LIGIGGGPVFALCLQHLALQHVEFGRIGIGGDRAIQAGKRLVVLAGGHETGYLRTQRDQMIGTFGADPGILSNRQIVAFIRRIGPAQSQMAII